MASEDIFRAIEMALEALLYAYGVRRIEYPGKVKKFKGRLALQFSLETSLLNQEDLRGFISTSIWKLLPNCTMEAIGFKLLKKSKLNEYLRIAEELIVLARLEIEKQE